ncbi:winged helix-turn-helix domain-containing tetratricopeptide repeat protein [Roseomonas sp. HF4]|uniref:winged helix-turn-helix domain-containing tetratricopeptide repeat protein n=1 Tax=Roseomonas sp. HF4 TaxID=2562313 RepID=UPI001484F1C6|nr:tetratricopeptide repeat protein [Roseomonas sp. HF4]
MAEKAEEEVLHFAGVTLDLGRGSLRNAAGAEVPLAPKPFDLLRTLAREAGRTVSKDALLDAVWPGVTVTEDSLFQAVRDARRAIGDEDGRVLRSVPRRGYMLDAVVNAAPAVPPVAEPLTPPEDRPSLVVLPFANLSGDAEQDYFADGMVEEITSALGCIRSFFVIARNSAFTYKGRAMDVRQVGRELGVRYVLEGSVRKAGGRVRIACQLAEAETGRQLWSERFDAALDDVFELQDRVTEAVAGALEPSLQRAEIDRVLRKGAQDLSAYDLFLQGLALMNLPKTESLLEAKSLFSRAVEIDPGFGAAYGMLGQCISLLKAAGVRVPPTEEIAEARRVARLAVEHGRDDTTALCGAAFALAYAGMDPDAAAVLIARASALNPNSARVWGFAAYVSNLHGDTDSAIASAERALRLSPRDPFRYAFLHQLTLAHNQAGRHEDAVAWGRRAVGENPNSVQALRTLAAALALAGRLDEARATMAEMLRLAPDVRLSTLSVRGPFKSEAYIQRISEAYRLAGMPE